MHGRLETAGWQLLTTFLPLTIAWVLIGAHVGVFDLQRVLDGKQLWRPFWAMILAGPMAGFLRAVWLNQGVAPLFVIILGGFAALSLLVWRIAFWAYWRWREQRAR